MTDVLLSPQNDQAPKLRRVTDPELLRQLEAAPAAPQRRGTLKPVTDPALLQQLNGGVQEDRATRAPRPQLPATPALPQGMPQGGPFSMLAPEPMNQPAGEFGAKDVKYLIDEGLVSGIDKVAGAPVDIATLVMNLLSKGATGAANLALPDEREFEAPQIEKPVLGSEWLHDLYLKGEQQAGRPVYTDEDVGLTTRVGASAADFGTQGLTLGTGLAARGLSQAAKKGVENLGPILQPYAKRPVATTAVDTSAGAGMGVTDQTLDEYDVTNPWVRFLVDSAGGWMGGRLAQAAVSPYAATQAIIDRVLPDPNIAPDNILGFAQKTSRADAQAAGKAVQDTARDPRKAAAAIEQETQIAREQGWTPPTSGQASNDPGLLYLEKRARLQAPSKDEKGMRGPMSGAPVFMERDRAIQDDLTRAVVDLGPQDGKPRIPTDLVTQEARAKAAEIEAARSRAVQSRESAAADTAQAQSRLAEEREARLAAARQRVTEAEDALAKAAAAEQAFGGSVQAPLGGKGPASESLAAAVGEAKAADEAVKRGMYQQAQAMSEGAALPIGDLGADVAAIKQELAPLVGHDRAVSNAIPDLDLLAAEGVTALPLAKVIAMLPRLSAAGDAATRNMRGDVAKAVGTIEAKLKARIQAMAEQGHPAARKWAEADANFRDNFAPKYRQGVGQLLDRAERRGAAVPPSAQAGLFLKPRGGGKEAAEDLNRILAGAPSKSRGLSAAYDYVLADLATLVSDSGVINPNRLRAWIANHQGMLSQLPAVKKEIDRLLVDVVNRREGSNATKKTLDAAVAERRGLKDALDRREKQILADARLNERRKAAEIAKIDQQRAIYEREMQSNAVRHLVDADPERAVASVLGSRDPERAMAEVVQRLKSDPEALKGWKRGVADYLYQQAKLVGAPDTPQGFDPVSLAKVSRVLESNRPALSKVFTPEEMRTLTRVQHTLDVVARKGLSVTAGSPTAENSMIMGLTEILLKTIYGGLQGGNKLRNFKVAMRLMPGAPKVARVDRLVERAMLDPELMIHLLNIPLKESAVPQWNRGLTRLLAARNAFAGDSGE